MKIAIAARLINIIRKLFDLPALIAELGLSCDVESYGGDMPAMRPKSSRITYRQGITKRTRTVDANKPKAILTAKGINT